eukprot:gene22462-28588_t
MYLDDQPENAKYVYNGQVVRVNRGALAPLDGYPWAVLQCDDNPLPTVTHSHEAAGWPDVLPHGGGNASTSSGSRYMGDWSMGLRHGLGTLEYSNGNTYTGIWHHHNKHDRGTMVSKTGGFTYAGDWSNNETIDDGLIEFESGDTLEGSFHCGYLHGNGTVNYHTDSTETLQSGHWFDRVRCVTQWVNAHETIYRQRPYYDSEDEVWYPVSPNLVAAQFGGIFVDGANEY